MIVSGTIPGAFSRTSDSPYGLLTGHHVQVQAGSHTQPLVIRSPPIDTARLSSDLAKQRYLKGRLARLREDTW
jgi:hypothetical protein